MIMKEIYTTDITRYPLCISHVDRLPTEYF